MVIVRAGACRSSRERARRGHRPESEGTSPGTFGAADL